MTPRLKYIRGRLTQSLPELRGAMFAVARRATWPKVLGTLSVIALGVTVLATFFISRSLSSAHVGETGEPSPLLDVTNLRDPLTGEKLSEPFTELPQVFSVMVENSYEAWPLSGLDQAFLVIEAPVEGNIPRFIAFFGEGEAVKKIGPVRSARPYYLDWADELASVYAHVGGSPEALELIQTLGTTKDLNEFSQGEYFWRDNTRFAPHNVYTSTDLLGDALLEVGRSVREYTPWVFTDGAPTGETLSPAIDWESGSVYDVLWQYDPETNMYTRVVGGVPMIMTSGARITASNVVAIETDVAVIDAVGRRDLETTGEGEGVVFQNGTRTSITWKKPTRTDRLRFYGEDGNEILMVAGKTWIEVLPDLTAVTESAQE